MGSVSDSFTGGNSDGLTGGFPTVAKGWRIWMVAARSEWVNKCLHLGEISYIHITSAYDMIINSINN